MKGFRTAGLRAVAASLVLMLVGALTIGHSPTPVVATAPIPSNSQRIALAGAELPLAGSERRPVSSILNVPKAMDYGEFVWNEAGVPQGPVWVRVDLRQQTLSVFRAGHEIGTAVILYGGENKPTPGGRFTVLEKRKDHRSSLYDAPMPYTLRLTDDGVAVHGSDVRFGAATHGCVGVPLGFAKRLFGVVQRGDEVVVVSGEAAQDRA